MNNHPPESSTSTYFFNRPMPQGLEGFTELALDLRWTWSHFSDRLWDRFITVFVCDKNPESAIGLIPMFGIGFHSFIDGVVYSITFSVSVFTGVLTAIGMVPHEFPEGIVTYVLLIRGGFTKKKAYALAFLAAALTTPLGTLVSFPMISQIQKPVLGAMLAISAGALVYVGATHLLPHAEHEPREYSLVALLGGILVALGIILSKP